LPALLFLPAGGFPGFSRRLNGQIIPEIDRHQSNQQLDAFDGLQNGIILFLSAMGNVLDASRMMVRKKTGPF
jgi:hypothetical protein